MDWNAATWWWIGAGVLVAAEMTTGTFYLLMLALGMGAAALAGHLGLAFSGQVLVAAVVGGGAVAAWHLRRQTAVPAASNHDVNLDIGEHVKVAEWRADRSTHVSYRGAEWAARYTGSDSPEPGDYVIRAIEGNRLLLGR